MFEDNETEYFDEDYEFGTNIEYCVVEGVCYDCGLEIDGDASKYKCECPCHGMVKEC